ncbi:hypothetical protein Cni_G15489 [Canna indica]|uniref:Protein FLX-like 3 n=1 Tax=Canna indica TaxID=4628 RepID=A0AAQ3KG77_9LILI|nr:hypothetical protein Cni_G15489 [Canna indica]
MVGRGRRRHRAFEEVWHGHPAPPTGEYVGDFSPHHQASLEEELELQMMNIRGLLADNRGLAEDRLAFHQELIDAKEKLNRMNFVIADIQADKEAHTRELIEKQLKLDYDLRNAEPLRDEIVQLRLEIKKLTAVRQELSKNVQSLTQDLTRLQADNQQIPSMKAEIDGLHQELIRLRTSIEYEKKGNFQLMEQRKSLDKDLVSMAYELEKLQDDFANAEGRSWDTSGGYGMNGNLAGSYPSIHAYEYGYHLPLVDKTPPYEVGSGSWGALDKSHVTRH